MKLQRKTWIIGACMLLILTLGIIFGVRAFYEAAPKKLLKIMADNIDLQVKNVVYTDVGQSGEKWEIRADTARYIKKENLALFDRVKVKLLTADGKIFNMTGDKGQLKTDTKNIEITGNVEIVSDKGDRFTTDKLNYVDAESKVYTESAVTMGNRDMQIRGVGMALNMKSGEVSVLSCVKADIKVK
jgi:LPS export ABC transporter protein LptC